MRWLIGLSAAALIGCGEAPPMETTSSQQGIIDGWSAPHSKYGWFVSLWNRNGIFGADKRICGGALIGSRYVLTAAHCVDSVHFVEVGPTTGAEIELDAIYVHPTMDVAILVMESSSSATPLALNRDLAFPGGVAVDEAGEDRANLTIAGHGDTSYGGDGSDDLLEVRIPAVSNSSCDAAYDSLASVADTELCAGFADGGQNSCNGDSGGALYASLGEEQVAVGLVSWAYGCAVAGYPTVYARIASAREWIDDHSSGVRWVSPAARLHAQLSAL